MTIAAAVPVNSNSLGIANARRASAVQQLSLDRDRAIREIAGAVIGQSGSPRAKAQTAAVQQVVDDLTARIKALAELDGASLVEAFPA